MNSQKTIEIASVNYRQLLEGAKKHGKRLISEHILVPEFQRGYIWRKRNIQDLFGLIETTKGGYLGNIVIVFRESNSWLIDGQQRLVTLSLICKTLFEKTKNKKTKEKIKKILFVGKDPRIEFSKKGLNKIYKEILKKDYLSLSESEDGDEKFIKDSKKNIEKFLSDIKSEKEIKDLLNLIISLKFVVIKCEDNASVYKLFQGLNATGVALTPLELIKNALIDKGTELGIETTIVKKWKKIEKIFQREDIFLQSKFFRQHFFGIHGYFGAKKLFETIFDKKIKGTDRKEIELYMSDLEESALIYLGIRNASINIPKGSRHARAQKITSVLQGIQDLNIEQVYSVLFAFFKYLKKEPQYLKNARVYEDIKKLWNFVFLAKFSKVVPSKYERLFASFCKEIGDINYSELRAKTNVFFETLAKLVENNEQVFIKNLSNYSLQNVRYQKSILGSIFFNPKEMNDFNIDAFSVEHIIPKGGDNKGNFLQWPKVLKLNQEKLIPHIFNLGNLLILEESLNHSAENKSLKTKTKLYKKSRIKSIKNIKLEDFDLVDPSSGLRQLSKKSAKKLFRVYLMELKKKE